MAFDLELARTAIKFTINEQDKGAQTSPEEKTALANALLENKNLLEVYNLGNGFPEQIRKKLGEHLLNNARALLEHSHIDVIYQCNDDVKHISKKNFRFDDPDFYKATRVVFTEFKLAEGVSDAELKLAALKSFMRMELFKCRHLQHCNFLGLINKDGLFLNDTQKKLINHIIYRNQRYLEKYQFDWIFWTAAVYGVVGLSTMLIPGFGILSGLLSAALLFVGGAIVGGAIDVLRERFLFKVGYNKLQELKQNKIPNDQSIKESLIAGENAKHWKGYINSFLNWKTYTPKNYSAYAAGLYTGVHRLKDQKEAIKKLRPN